MEKLVNSTMKYNILVIMLHLFLVENPYIIKVFLIRFRMVTDFMYIF